MVRGQHINLSANWAMNVQLPTLQICFRFFSDMLTWLNFVLSAVPVFVVPNAQRLFPFNFLLNALLTSI